MDAIGILSDGFDRVRQTATAAVEGLPDDQLVWRADAEANTIAWLAWHLARVQDDHVADVGGHDQVWLADGWCDRFALPVDDRAIGYGFSSDDVAAIRVSAELLTRYLDAVCRRTAQFLGTLDDADLDRVVDDSYDPPVTLGARLMSVISDDLQHAGQAAYVRGLIERR